MNDRKVVWATVELEFEIRQCDVDNGIPTDSDKCPGSLSLIRQFGDTIEQTAFGRGVVKIYTPGQVTKYRPERRISRATLEFDKTGEFTLPVGRYKLLPYLPEKRSKGGGRDKRPGTHGKFTGHHLPYRTSNFEKALRNPPDIGRGRRRRPKHPEE